MSAEGAAPFLSNARRSRRPGRRWPPPNGPAQTPRARLAKVPGQASTPRWCSARETQRSPATSRAAGRLCWCEQVPLRRLLLRLRPSAARVACDDVGRRPCPARWPLVVRRQSASGFARQCPDAQPGGRQRDRNSAAGCRRRGQYVSSPCTYGFRRAGATTRRTATAGSAQSRRAPPMLPAP